ncbi:MAG: hypothetical protein KDD35_04460 [Bdellovibrionales bacterium]|nr:hypothetical protein [Bdellovibrionales bacterium]
MDGSLIEAWASLKSFQRKDKAKTTDEDSDKGTGNQSVDFYGEVCRQV